MSKRAVGGEYLLDLSSIEIEESEDGTTKTNITDADVLEQLTNLKKYVSNPNGIKPVWVKMKNGETDELIVARGTFANVDTGEFEICVQLNGYKLVISIEFTQVLNEDDEPIDDWFIDTNDAKYLFTSDAQNIGAISELPIFENIVDAQGHKRFIEGDITIETIEGVTQTYGKWSLSGSHLMMVVAIRIANATSISNLNPLCKINLPAWVIDKIVAIYGIYIARNKVAGIGSGEDYDYEFSLRKVTNEILIYPYTFTTLRDENLRIEFDLLIDNE